MLGNESTTSSPYHLVAGETNPKLRRDFLLRPSWIENCDGRWLGLLLV